jgi:hypothetical protein
LTAKSATAGFRFRRRDLRTDLARRARDGVLSDLRPRYLRSIIPQREQPRSIKPNTGAREPWHCDERPRAAPRTHAGANRNPLLVQPGHGSEPKTALNDYPWTRCYRAAVKSAHSTQSCAEQPMPADAPAVSPGLGTVTRGRAHRNHRRRSGEVDSAAG